MVAWRSAPHNHADQADFGRQRLRRFRPRGLSAAPLGLPSELSINTMNDNAELFRAINSRVTLDQQEGDIAYFHALTLKLEYVAKLVTLGVVACLGNDADRNKYSLEYKLVRADSLGDWVGILNSALTGPSAQFFLRNTTHIAQELTERVSNDDWRYETVYRISNIAQQFGLDAKIGVKVALRQFFEFSTAIRNRTRGHGATTSQQCGNVCPLLSDALDLLVKNCSLFHHDWAYLHRNLSGKYRIAPLLGKCLAFEHLKSSRDIQLSNGVWVDIGGLVNIPILYSNSSLNDFFVPNGNFKSNEFETLSYISNEVSRQDGSPWSTPPGRLPPSHTEGSNRLDQYGNTFANLPRIPSGHIKRVKLENLLKDELLNTDRHPIVTLTGPGGIGKTTIALAVIEELTKSNDCPYDVVLWMSARDVDLLESGPKPVTPRVVTKEAISKTAVELIEPNEKSSKDFSHQIYFQNCLMNGAAGTTLFILDNFETVDSPVDVFNWIDTYIRNPNKILITTRFRDFNGDFPIEIKGMTDQEASKLISQESARLGISDILTHEYRASLMEESEGHPYVIKIMLGQISKERRAIKPERIIASADQLLTALFERTYVGLKPASQRVFLLLSSWRVFVPAISVEAVSLRPGNERFDVQAALDELRRYSLIEEITTDIEDEFFVGVPLVAASFGRRKLEASPFKVAVDLDKKLLMEFGAGSKDSSSQGVLPRIDRLVKSAALQASENPEALNRFMPILEYLSTRVPEAHLRIAQLIDEISTENDKASKIKKSLRQYLENPKSKEKMKAWNWLADLCHSNNDAVGEVHALSEVAFLPTSSPETIGIIANRINIKLRELKERGVSDCWSDEVDQLINRVAEVMAHHLNELDATDCSRLAWLYLNIGNTERARDIAYLGLQKEKENEHCMKLVQRLDR